MYKSLPDEEKAKWEAHASQDKARFEAEMASYVPPPGYDQAGNLMEDHRRAMNKKYQKKSKDPEQPKVRAVLVLLNFLCQFLLMIGEIASQGLVCFLYV